jgi:glyoxylase-like metal-dependent hydrolase (beta-lactamase superfamily II)
MAAPFAGTQMPGVYRLKVGAFEVTVLSDGNLPFEPHLFAGDPARAQKLLERAFVPREAPTTSVNAWLVNTGDKLILVDTGASTHFGPTLGRLPHNLAAAGVGPDAVDDIVITHMHPDHVPGLVSAERKMLFKNAVVHVNSDEHAFWTSPEVYAKAPDAAKGFFDLARMAIKPYADAGKVQTYKDGAQVLPGLTAMAAPGHTIGHSMVGVSSAGSDLLIWGDIVHNAALQFPEPDRSIAYDADPATAIASRKKVFDMVATDRLLFAGAHLPFPGLGNAIKTSTGYAYVPSLYAEDLRADAGRASP